jgi:hypothetical protein
VAKLQLKTAEKDAVKLESVRCCVLGGLTLVPSRVPCQNRIKLKDTSEALKVLEKDVSERLIGLEADVCRHVDAATASVRPACLCVALLFEGCLMRLFWRADVEVPVRILPCGCGVL